MRHGARPELTAFCPSCAARVAASAMRCPICRGAVVSMSDVDPAPAGESRPLSDGARLLIALSPLVLCFVGFVVGSAHGSELLGGGLMAAGGIGVTLGLLWTFGPYVRLRSPTLVRLRPAPLPETRRFSAV